MNFFEKVIYFLQAEMNRPNPYGWFHFLWIGLIAISLIVLYKLRKTYSEKQLKIVLAIYGIVAFILELAKQIIWSYNYDIVTGIGTWDYQWYASPFQLCSTPIYVSVLCLFMKKTKIRDSLLSYMAFITILGGLMTVIIPDSCFVETTLVNVHTMWLHCGSLVVSLYLLFTGEVKIKFCNLRNAVIVFLIFLSIAEILNISIYNLGVLNVEEFNMFYISPYFISSLPVFNTIQQTVPFIIFLLLYIFAIIAGGGIIYVISLLLSHIKRSE
ncbi:MAG: YwaF family protein [Bacilli bacterium]|nr:YwaF family protein [Bacilli bacterium]